MAEEIWYIPVDIGEHLEQNNIIHKKLNRTQVKEIFEYDVIINKNIFGKYENLRNEWLKKKDTDYLKKFKDDKSFSIDNENHPISADVYQFSKSKAKIYIRFLYGHSRWHHYYILLDNLLLERDPFIDKVFNLIELENKYSYSFKGVAHGVSADRTEKLLGGDYYEYAGQSPQYRNIYYEKYNLEIIIQNFEVKHLQKGRPGWMDTDMKYKNK